MRASVSCPYCGEQNSIVVDEPDGRRAVYVEDCQVCCRPWQVTVTVSPDGNVEVDIRTEDE